MMRVKLQTNFRLLVVLVVLLGLTAASAPASAQDELKADTSDQDIEGIYRRQLAASNAGDVEESVKYYAEDAVTVYLPPPPDVEPITRGKAALREATVTMFANHPYIVYTDFHVTGNTATYRTMTTDDFLKNIGVGYLEFSCTTIMRDGLIIVETCLMDKESQDRLEAALKLQANKDVVLRFYDDVFSQGNMAVADEIIDENFGANFTGDRTIPDESNGLNGLAATKQAIIDYRKLFPDLTLEITDVVAEGDLVVVNVHGSGTYQGGLEDAGVPQSAIGKKVTWYWTDYTKVVNGKMVEAWGSHDDLPWFQQLGMKLVAESE